jgi:hypothetical protein
VITATPLIGLGTGMLLAAVGLAVWSGLQQMKGLLRAIRAISWMASGFLLFALPFLWIEAHGHYWIVLHLTLMAAIAAPPAKNQEHSPWHSAVRMLPSLVLSGTSLAFVAGTIQRGVHYTGLLTVPVVIIRDGLTALFPAYRVVEPWVLLCPAYMICDGLVARVLGEALGTLVGPDVPPGRLFDALYLLLTLLVGANALVNLRQRGGAGEGSGNESGLIGAWLVWSAAWLSRRWHPRIRAGLTAAAALLLIVLALTGGGGQICNLSP